MKTRILIVSTALVAGLGVGLAVNSGADAGTPPQPEFKVNGSGQTFGQMIRGGERPDFVGPMTTPVGTGYFKADDWVPPKGPNGAPSHDRVVVPDKNGDIKIPVYAFDGKTVIGMATIAHVSDGDGE